jgi:hypothetical protein
MKKYLFPLLLAAATAALAGPPAICHPVEIGKAKSLPWRDNVNGWDGTVPGYDLASLTADTLAILTPSASVPLRMETIRRAAIYAARNEAVAEKLTARLIARIADVSGKADANAWFDAGYFAEALRQMGMVYRYNMVPPEEKANWKIRGEGSSLDGQPWIEKAMQLGGKGMEVALVKVREYRTADRKRLVSSVK